MKAITYILIYVSIGVAVGWLLRAPRPIKLRVTYRMDPQLAKPNTWYEGGAVTWSG